MFDSDLLVVWMPTRVHPRTVVDQAAKYGLSISEGCGEPEARALWMARPGLVFSVVGWQGEWAQDRVNPPGNLRDFLATVADAEPRGFELTFWREPPTLDTHTALLGLGHADFPGGICVRILPV